MQEIRYVNVNGNRIPVLISDEREALLAAKAAGRAVVELLGSQGCGRRQNIHPVCSWSRTGES